jgi:hypothetical protein
MAQAARVRQDRQHLYQWPKPLFPKCNRSADQTDLACGDRHGAPPTGSPPRVVAALAFVNCEKLATVAPSKITALRGH